MVLNPTLHFVDSIDEVMLLKQWMSVDRPYIAVDTETEGLQWWRHRPRMLQIGDTQEAFAIPWHLWGGAILEVLREYRGEIVMHNMPFDIMMFERWSGVKLPRHRIHDTRIQAHLLEPHLPTGLKAVAERWVDKRAAQSQRVLTEAMKLHSWDWDTVPIDFQPYWVYAAMDVVLTSYVHEHHLPIIQATCPSAYTLERAVSHVLIDMMWRGVAIDEEYTRKKLEEFKRYVEVSGEWVEREYGVKPGSDLAVVNRLQQDIPPSVFEFTKLTKKTQRLSLDKEVLTGVVAATHHPLAEVVFQRRRINRVCSAYLGKFLELAVDGRIHPNFNPTKRSSDDTEDDTGGYGAKTGRMSVSDPPLQQLPRKDNDNPVASSVRPCIVASPGNKLLMCDFDQVEFRTYAHLCRDPGLMAAFGEGDFFVNMAREIYSDPTFQKKDPRRQTTKNAGYAKIYGAGIPKFAATAGIDEQTAASFMARMDQLYPGMNAFNQMVDRIARDRDKDEGTAYVLSPLTNRRFINDDGRYYALVNYLVQGMSAEILKMKNVELAQAGLDEYLVLDVHDEMILDAPYTMDIAEVAGGLMGIMEDDTLLTVPLTASLDIADNWGGKS